MLNYLSSKLGQDQTPIEIQTIVPDSEWAFGYFGRHFIMRLPKDSVPKEISLNEVPTFFELQIKTLFHMPGLKQSMTLGTSPSTR